MDYLSKSLTRFNTKLTRAQSELKKLTLALRRKLSSWYDKKVVPLAKSLPRRSLSIFAENIYGTWLLRRWSSIAGYLLAFLISLGALVLVDRFEYTRQFIHMPNSNEAIIGAFTILLALLIPLAFALIQGDGDNPFARQTMVKTIIRFGKASFVLLAICVGLFIPPGIHVAGESLTLKSLYAPVLVVCLVFILASFYRSIRWLGDESTYSTGAQQEAPPENPHAGGFSSYRFAWIVRLLKNTKSFQTWLAIWSQWFPAGYEETIHQAFFNRQYEVMDKSKRKKYRTLSLELDAYDKNFSKRNQHSHKFEYEYPEKFFTLYGKITQTLEERYVDSRMDGLWQGKEATKNISVKYINALMTRQRVWSLFEGMSRYLKGNDLIEIREDKIREDELSAYLLKTLFNAIKKGDLSAHDASHHFSDADSAWIVTYEHLYGRKTRYNLGFLVQNAYWEWLRSSLDELDTEDYLLKNDSITEMVFPETDPIMMGKLYWMVYLGSSGDYLNLWITRQRPIGLISFGPGFQEVTTSKEEAYESLRKDVNTREYNSVKLFCNLYWRYLRTNFMDLEKNIKKAKTMDRSTMDETKTARLDDFILIAESILKFYEASDKKVNKSIPKSKT